MNENELSIQSYKQAVAIEPVRADFYNFIGLAYFELRKYNEAIDYFDKAIERNVLLTYAYVNRAFANKELKQYRKAIDDIEKAIKIDPNYEYAYYARATINMKLLRYPEAIKDFEKAIELNPISGCFNPLGSAYRCIGDYSNSIKNCQKAVESDSLNQHAFYNLGYSYYMNNQPYHSSISFLKGFSVDDNVFSTLTSYSFNYYFETILAKPISIN